MLQTPQISKLTSLRASFAALAICALTSISGLAIAADPAPAAPMADTKAVVPGKPKVDAAAGESLYSAGDATRGVVACITCHGPKGQSAVGTWPKLSAQHAAYTAKQLRNYKDGTRANAVMMGMSAALTEQDMNNIAAFLVKQEPSLGVAQSKDTIALGQSIYRGGIAARYLRGCGALPLPVYRIRAANVSTRSGSIGGVGLHAAGAFGLQYGPHVRRGVGGRKSNRTLTADRYRGFGEVD